MSRSSMSAGYARALALGLPAILCTVATAQSPPSSVVEISGRPVTEVQEGELYFFRAGAVVTGPGTLRFTIENQPSWATFDPMWGGLRGVPTAADAGTHGPIRISAVTDNSSVSLPAFTIAVRAKVYANGLTLEWQPPMTYEDGSTLTDLAGYRVYWGSQAENLQAVTSIPNPGATSHYVSSLPPGINYFALTSITAEGAESDYSPLVSVTGPAHR